MTDKQTLAERLEARADFEDKRVLDEAKAMGFVPEVYSGSQTGALLREAAQVVRAVEGAAAYQVVLVGGPDHRDFLTVELGEASSSDFQRGQRVALVPVGQEGR